MDSLKFEILFRQFKNSPFTIETIKEFHIHVALKQKKYSEHFNIAQFFRLKKLNDWSGKKKHIILIN